MLNLIASFADEFETITQKSITNEAAKLERSRIKT